MTTTEREEIEKLTGEIRDRAPVAAAHRAAYNLATHEEFEARLDLLNAAIRAARPAIREIAAPLPILRSGSGCALHGVPKGTNRTAPIVAVQALPSLAVELTEGGSSVGLWWMDAQGDRPNCEDRNCWTYDWKPIAVHKVVETVPLVTVVRGILERIDEQLQGSRLKLARKFDVKAERLRALCTLLGDPEER